MKDNIIRRIGIYPERERNLHKYVISEYVESKKEAVMCSECFTVIGITDRSYGAIANVKSSIKSPELNEEINRCIDRSIFSNRDFWDFNHYCKCCGKNTDFFFIDKNMIEPIQKLNVLGIKTAFSCEGHSVGDIAYIAFPNRSDIKYFDMQNELLKSWRIIEPSTNKNTFGIYLNLETVTIDENIDNKHITDLVKYIDEFIEPQKRGGNDNDQ